MYVYFSNIVLDTIIKLFIFTFEKKKMYNIEENFKSFIVMQTKVFKLL